MPEIARKVVLALELENAWLKNDKQNVILKTPIA